MFSLIFRSFLLAILMSGCAALYPQGQMRSDAARYFNAGNYEAAYQNYVAAFNAHNHGDLKGEAAYWAGRSKYAMQQYQEARYWTTLATRYGNRDAQTFNARLGWPIGSPDLAERPDPPSQSSDQRLKTNCIVTSGLVQCF